MSSVPATSIDLEFADGTYTFQLGLAQIAELQTKCGVGIGPLYARVVKGRYLIGGEAVGNPMEAEYYAADLIETIRQGLIGGRSGIVNDAPVEVKPIDATRLVTAYCYPEQPLNDAWGIAAAILSTAIEGYVSPDKKKEQPVKATARSTTRKRSSIAR